MSDGFWMAFWLGFMVCAALVALWLGVRAVRNRRRYVA